LHRLGWLGEREGGEKNQEREHEELGEGFHIVSMGRAGRGCHRFAGRVEVFAGRG
jgi:hypothetical protein